MASSFSSPGVPAGEDTQGVAVGWIVAGPLGRRTHPGRVYRRSRSERLSFRQPGHRRIGGDPNRGSWRRDRRRYKSCCLAVRSRNLKESRFTINTEFEQNRISYGQPGLGRWKGPFRRVRIGKNRKRSHIIKWCQLSVVSGPLLNACTCVRVGGRWHSSSTANYG